MLTHAASSTMSSASSTPPAVLTLLAVFFDSRDAKKKRPENLRLRFLAFASSTSPTALTHGELAAACGLSASDLASPDSVLCKFIAQVSAPDSLLVPIESVLVADHLAILFNCLKNADGIVPRDDAARAIRVPLDMLHDWPAHFTLDDFVRLCEANASFSVDVQLEGGLLSQLFSAQLAKATSVVDTSIVPQLQEAVIYMQSRWLELFWLAVFFGMCALIFVTYYRSAEVPAVIALGGSLLPTARGSAKVINFCVFLVLLAMCRSLITMLRSINHGILLYVFPFDSSVSFHKLVGVVMLAWTLVHVIAWSVAFNVIPSSTANEQTAVFGNNSDVPYTTTTLWTRTTAGVTGIMLVIIAAVAFPLSLPYFRRTHRFEVFYFSHMLFLPFVIILCVHGTQQLLKAPFQTVYWVIIPLFIYVIDRVIRYLGVHGRFAFAQVRSVKAAPFGITTLEVSKPDGYSKPFHNFVPGCYAFINIPRIKQHEWHPFTVVSAPDDANLAFVVQGVGDWTNRLHVLASEAQETHSLSVVGDVFVDGPFGAPSQSFYAYSTVVLVAAGVGITPYVSILKQVYNVARLHRCQRCGSHQMPRTFSTRFVTVVWCARTEGQLRMFDDLLDGVVAAAGGMVRILRYYTGGALTSDRGDLIRGRPNFEALLRCAGAVAAQVSSDPVGVFFTGPRVMGQSLRQACLRATRELDDKGVKISMRFSKEIF